MKQIIFTDCDLDGIGTYLMFKWYTRYKGEVEICSQSNFRKTYTAWSKKNNPDSYDKIYIFDLDVSQNNMDLVDRKNFVIIDHHETHIENLEKYKNAKCIVKVFSSCCKLMYTLLKAKYTDRTLTDTQKLLMLMVDDYDSYELKLKDSYNLNVVLWNYVGNRAQQFERDFGTGFSGFTQTHLNIIHLNNKKVARVLKELEVFKGILPVGGVDRKLYATMASTSLNEVASYVIDTYDDCDICVVVNLTTKRVSFRKNKESIPDLDLGQLAKRIAEGGGHKDSAGGSLNDNMMTLTSMLQRVN